MKLTTEQWVRLARRGIVVRIQYDDGLAKCFTPEGERKYEIRDLIAIAQPSIGERLIGFFGRAA